MENISIYLFLIVSHCDSFRVDEIKKRELLKRILFPFDGMIVVSNVLYSFGLFISS